MAQTSFVYTTSDKLSSIDIIPGQIIFCQDDNSIRVDNQNNVRVNYSNVIDIATDAERLALENPTRAIYFVVETGSIWKYTTTWIQLTGDSSQQIVFADIKDFPEIGMSRRLYVDGINIYRWKDGRYQLMTSQHDKWEAIPAV